MPDHSIGIVFPGQGSQSLGMLADIATKYPEIKITFERASQVLSYDLWQLIQDGPEAELNKTVHTQPALLTASFALWQILQSRSQFNPILFAGHSLGEYSALVCTKALQFEDAVKLVAARGQYMQEAVPEGIGAMAAIMGLENQVVADLCREIVKPGEVLAPANFNSIGQVVIAGHKTAVERAVTVAKEKGAKLAVMIPVSVPSHSELMLPAAHCLEKTLKTISFQIPNAPVISNVDVMPYTDEVSIKDGLVRQLYKPVRWVETVQLFSQQHITHIVECGPGKVLTGLTKRIDKNLQMMTTSDLKSLEAMLTFFSNERGAA